MTAEEIEEEYIDKYGHGDINKMLIEFAKYHVQKALKVASENSNKIWSNPYTQDTQIIKNNINSILNAYPLENIK